MANSCEFEYMEYMDENSIDSNLMCSVCHKPYKDPVCTPCDHTFGRGCLTHWLTHNVNYSCPLCVKQPLLIKDLTQASRPLRNILDQLRVQCLLCEQSNLHRGNFLDHISKVCPKAEVPCQGADLRCPWKGTREELNNHMTVCVFEPLRPVLGPLIAENRQLQEQVKKHEDEIQELIKQMSQPSNIHDSDAESDIASLMDIPTGHHNEKEEDAIFIKNLPWNVRYNDLFELFSRVGRIKFNSATQKPCIFIFKNPRGANSPRTAKIVYIDKASVPAAIIEYNNKHIDRWNTRISVAISYPKRNNFKEGDKEETVVMSSDDKSMGACAKDLDKEEKVSTATDQTQPSTEPKQTKKNNPIRRGQYHSRQNEKPAN